MRAADRKRFARVLGACVAILLAAFVLRLLCGAMGYGWPEPRILGIRLQRAVLACLVGAALSTGGVILQSLLRNPLAEPYILGVSTGAGLGILAQLYLVQLQLIGPAPDHVGGLLGALASLAIVYVAGRRHGVLDPLGLLLVGVVLATINGALITLLQYLSSQTLRENLAYWMMGYLNESLPRPTVYAAAIIIAVCVALAAIFHRAMDLAALSDAEAVSLGLALARCRTILFLAAGALTAAAVVLAGPIAFVGFIAPHLVRLWAGPLHSRVLPASMLIGAAIILTADSLSTIIHMHTGIGTPPIGVFTAVLAGPLFLWMLRPQLGRGVE